MFRGRVSPRFEPLVPLDLVETEGQIYQIEVLLDTGFDGSLLIPDHVIKSLGFPLYDDFVSTLADGRSVVVQGFDGQVMWHGRLQSVLILESKGEALLGMNLLWRNRITIDNYANGPVVVEELE